jgi:hypothetical protein
VVRVGRALAALALTLVAVSPTSACGGLFCQSTPVDQQAERIIFTINPKKTVTAYVQINYTGSAPDFSWVVPVPAVPEVDVAEMASFDELSRLTAPVFIAPQRPNCLDQRLQRQFQDIPMAAMAAEEGAVEVLAQGTAGPYGFEVVRSDDPDALIRWLREHRYRITPPMEPLVHAYTAEEALFLAMRLLPEAGVTAQDIQPVKMTYAGTVPAIPIRLTAVAANPNMSVLTWVFATAQAAPGNYANPTVDPRNLRNDPFRANGTNYLDLLDLTVDLSGGQALVTEYAQTTTDFLIEKQPTDQLVVELARKHEYVTRLFGRLSPEEMTRDPTFVLARGRPDISNIRDLSRMNSRVYWGCRTKPIRIG